MGITQVQFRVYSGEDYDAALEQVRASPGWLEMSITETEAYAENDPLAEMTAHFDTEAHAMLFRLKAGV
jgi:3-methyladenine DNA glycosylase Mpg